MSNIDRQSPRAIAEAADGGFERIEHTDLAELTYRAIRKRILARELRTGEQIRLDTVASMLGVSRTPVVDALKRLESEGLVEIRARRGCFVRALMATDIQEVFEVREAIELFSIRAAIRGGRHVALADTLDGITLRMVGHTSGDAFDDYDQFIEWDRAFHVALVGASGNGRMQELYRNLHVHLHIMRVHYFRELEAASRVNADHAAILSAIRAGRLSAAERAMSAHLAAICGRATTHLREGGSL